MIEKQFGSEHTDECHSGGPRSSHRMFILRRASLLCSAVTISFRAVMKMNLVWVKTASIHNSAKIRVCKKPDTGNYVHSFQMDLCHLWILQSENPVVFFFFFLTKQCFKIGGMNSRTS